MALQGRSAPLVSSLLFCCLHIGIADMCVFLHSSSPKPKSELNFDFGVAFLRLNRSSGAFDFSDMPENLFLFLTC